MRASTYVDGVRVVRDMTPDEIAKAAFVSADPTKYTLTKIKLLEILYDDTREADVLAVIAALPAAGKLKARAYLDGGVTFNWSDPEIQVLAGRVTEGAAAFEAAWVAKATE